MKRVLFYVRDMNYRGVAGSIYDYAKYNEEILGNESVIAYYPYCGTIHEDEVLAKFEKRFSVRQFEEWAELDKIASKFDVFYSQKSGRIAPPIVKSTKSVVHVVFQFNEPHGGVYAYISEWLSDYMYACTGIRHPWVPLIINLPLPDMNEAAQIRNKLGISKSAFVFGRLGGYETFDISFVKDTIKEIVESTPEYEFIFPYTEPFHTHAQIHHLDPILTPQEKSNFIAACDGMIHARKLGESFGLAIHEFLFHNKPVLAWEEGDDRNHIRLLQPYDTLYNENNIKQKLLNLKNHSLYNYRTSTEPYAPEKVMAKFNKVFLE